MACGGPPAALDEIKSHGVLRAITRNSPTTYFEGTEGPTGVEYDLLNLFAQRLGAKLELVIPENFDQILPMIANREAHLAAAGLTVTLPRSQRVRFSAPYQKITQQLVYMQGTRRPRKIEDLYDANLEVVAGSSHVERLLALKSGYPELSWTANREMESEQLLYLVKERLIDFTVADSNELQINRRYYPELRVAFDLTAAQELGWAFPPGPDDSLYLAAEEFFTEIRANGTLEQILDRYYGHVEQFNYVDLRAFRRHILTRLPRYRELFEKAARKNGFDWRLLAAIGYQESHWRPEAVSPTGVRGIMMLTANTASELGIPDRTDPWQSIEGGARYIDHVKQKIPDRIAEPDRTWMALAAYNVGFGHLEDARRLTQRRKGNPDKWIDVKQNLPLLSQKKWYKKTRYGYARGREPVRYVGNIRSYYDILVWLDKRENPEPVQRGRSNLPSIELPAL